MFRIPQKLLRWLHHKIEAGVFWLDRHRLLGWAQGALALVMFAIPTAADFALVKNLWWYAGAVLCAVLFGTLEIYEARLDGVAFNRVARNLAHINGSFAGAVESIRADLLGAKGRRLSHDQCKHLCTGLLRRILEYAAIVLEVSDKPRLRASLLVPLHNPATGEVYALRVWCYDESHMDRGNTLLPLYVNNKEIVPGGPRAYLTGEIVLLPDVHAVPFLPDLRRRPYRAVVSFPLDAQDPATGRPLGVVSIDADEPDFFELQSTVEKLRPMIAPALNTMGLVLALRNKGQDYVFRR